MEFPNNHTPSTSYPAFSEWQSVNEDTLERRMLFE